MGYIGMCDPKGYGFKGVFVKKGINFGHFSK